MSLLTILLALLIERFVEALETVRRHGWLSRYTAWLQGRLPFVGTDGFAGLALVLLGPLLLIGLVGLALGWLHEVVAFLFGLAVLVWAIGPYCLPRRLEGYLEAREREDNAAAWRHAEGILGPQRPETPEATDCAVADAVLIGAERRLVGVCLWFVLLGPLGAVLYRLTAELAAGDPERATTAAATTVLALLVWPSARLTALGYMLAGSYAGALQAWRGHAQPWREGSDRLLADVGAGALDSGEACRDAPRQAYALAKRMALIWLTVLALLVIAGLVP